MAWHHIIFCLTAIIFCAFRFSQGTPCSLYMNKPNIYRNRNWWNILFSEKMARDVGEWPLLFVSLSNCVFEAYRLLCSLFCLATARSVKLSVETMRTNNLDINCSTQIWLSVTLHRWIVTVNHNCFCTLGVLMQHVSA